VDLVGFYNKERYKQSSEIPADTSPSCFTFTGYLTHEISISLLSNSVKLFIRSLVKKRYKKYVT